jgi:hypothetical protein
MVADPKIVREVGTLCKVWLSSRSPIFAFSTSTTGDSPLTVTVSWSARGVSREVRCLVRDDGVFTVPHDYLASLPAPAQLLSAEVATVRTGRAAVRAPGVEKGQLRIALRDVIVLPVSPWTATASTPPAPALDER